MNVYKFLLLVLALAVTPDPSAAEVQNVTYCDPQVADGPSWEVDHTLPLFDPSLGDLIGVNLTANLELFQNYSAENLGVAPQNVDLNYSVELVVTNSRHRLDLGRGLGLDKGGAGWVRRQAGLFGPFGHDYRVCDEQF